MKPVRRLTIKDYDDSIIDWIEENLDAQPRLDELASKLGYSKRMVQLYFQDKHGISIGDYINNRRLYRACTLLRMTDLAVGEIACILRYGNHNNFCRAFKKRLHCTPSDFRLLPQHMLPTLGLPQTIYRDEFSHHMVTLTNKTLYGVPFQYEDQFTKPGKLGAPIRIQRLRAWFKDSHTPLTIASDVIRGSSTLHARDELITVSAIAGHCLDTATHANTPDEMAHYELDGLYLCCPFYGSFEGYAKHNIDIYRSLLPKLKLARRDVRDVEIFHFTHHVFDAAPQIFCEHYIPVTRVD